MAEAFSLAAVTPSSGGPQSAGLSINVVPLVDGTPSVCLRTHLRDRDRSGHEELLKVEGRMHSLESVLPHPRYQSLCTTKSRILLFQLHSHTHTHTYLNPHPRIHLAGNQAHPRSSATISDSSSEQQQQPWGEPAKIKLAMHR